MCLSGAVFVEFEFQLGHHQMVAWASLLLLQPLHLVGTFGTFINNNDHKYMHLKQLTAVEFNEHFVIRTLSVL